MKLYENMKKKTVVSSKKSSSKNPYSYISYVDGVIYIDKDWATCSKRVLGKKNVLFKKSFSQADEQNIIHEFKAS
jgi:hypothetical protein